MTERHEWKISTSGPPWIVIDWATKRHTFNTRDEAMEFIERDKRLLDQYAQYAYEDATNQINKALSAKPRRRRIKNESSKNETSESEEA